MLNWAVRVRERVEAASSAASMRLALASAARAAKTRQWGAARARRSGAAMPVFGVPPPLPATWAACRALKSLEPTTSLDVASAGVSERSLRARCTASAALKVNVVELGAVGS